MSSSYWTTGKKLRSLMGAGLFGITTMGLYMQWQDIPKTAIVPGMGQSFARTVDIILESRDKRYLLFVPSEVDSALSGAYLRTSAGLTATLLSLSGDSAGIERHHSRWHSDDYPGLSIHVTGEVSGTDSRSVGTDTLWLELPGVKRLAARYNDTPLRVRSYPEPLDSSFVERFTHYPSLAAVERARQPWHVGWIVTSLLFVGVAVHTIYRVGFRSEI